jgi:hypothetical protein
MHSDRFYLITCLVIVMAAIMYRGLSDVGKAVRSFDPQPSSPAGIAVADVFFAGQDCGSEIEALHFLNRPHASGVIYVSGRLYGPGSELGQASKVVRGAGLKFPVFPVGRRELARARSALGYEVGSFVVFRDSEGRVRFSQSLRDLARPASRAHALDLISRMETEDAQPR